MKIRAQQTTQLTQYRLNLLVHLARFNYLTKKQMLYLGITTDQSNLTKRVLKPLIESNQIFCANVGGTYLFALTSSGAETASKILMTPNVYFPPHGIQFMKDLRHRCGCIDVMIRLHQHCEQQGSQIEFLHTYYHNGSSRASKFVPKTRHQVQGNLFTEADIEFMLTDDNRKRSLFVFEYHRGHRADRIHTQLSYHRIAIALNVLKSCYRFPGNPIVLSVYEKPETMKTVMKRIKYDREFQAVLDCFAFASLDSVLDDFPKAWLSLSGQENLFLQ